MFVDYLTKRVEVFPTPDQSALTIARLLVSEIISRHRVPRELLSGRGAAFLSQLLPELYQLLGIHKVSTTAYHPQTDGLVERFHRTLTDMLSRFPNQAVLTGTSDCHSFFSHIGVVSKSLHVNRLFSCCTAETQCCLPKKLSLHQSSDATSITGDYRSQIIRNLSEAWAKARQNIHKAQKRQKKQHDKKTRMPTVSVG